MNTKEWMLLLLSGVTVLIFCWYHFWGGSGELEDLSEQMDARIQLHRDSVRLKRQVKRLQREKKKQKRKKKGRIL